MKILILVTTVTRSFCIGHHGSPSIEIVASPQQAAIYIYNNRPQPYEVEPDHKEYELYSVDLVVGEIVKIPIPKLIFQSVL